MSMVDSENMTSVRSSQHFSPNRRRLLVVSHVGDDRQKNGGTVYTRSLLELIRAGRPKTAIDLVFFTRQKPAIVRQLRQVKALLRASFSHLPSKVLYFRSRAFADKLVAQLHSGKYDLVLIDHAEMLWCLDLIPPNTAVLAVAHNIESRIYEQFLRHRPISKRLFRWDLAKYQRFEIDRLRRVRNVVAISADDACTLREAVSGLDVLVIPPTFSYEPARRDGKVHQPLRFGMLGNFEWWPNREGYNWFIDKVWSRARDCGELHVFGAQSQTLSEAPNVIRHGYADKLSDVWQSIDLMINPIISGSGVNVKVAEAMFNGVPMLCTPMAVAGLLTKPDPAIVVLDHAEQWIELLEGGEAIAVAQRQPRAATRRQVEARTHVAALATFVDRLISEVEF
jgi:glycosyltransferase involved in cell wall biosynthesis